MIDRDEMRIARRTVERNGYTVLPPRERDEEDLNRFRSRRNEERKPVRTTRNDEDDDDVVERQPRFKPLRSRNIEDDEPVKRPIRKPISRNWDDDEDDEPVVKTRRPVSRSYDDAEDDYEPVRKQPVRRPAHVEDDEDDYEPVRKRPVERKPLSDLERAKRTAEFNGYTVQKMSRLDQAKQVAQDAGYEVRKASRPTTTVADEEETTPAERPIRRVATRDGAPMRRPVIDREMAKANRDAVRTRTAPDVEIKDDVKKVEPETTPTTPKKPTFEDDYVKRAAAFFGDDE